MGAKTILALIPLLLVGCGNAAIEVHEGWQYRWGDSPKTDGQYDWSVDHAGAWRDIENPGRFPDRRGREKLWLRVQLPDVEVPNPTIFITNIFETGEIFLDGEMIYMPESSSRRDRYEFARWHMFQLPPHSKAKWLYFRIFSNDRAHIGVLIDGDNKVLFGSQLELTSALIRTSVDRFVLGCLFFLFGIYSIDLFSHRREQRPYYYLSFGVFGASTGLMFAFSAEMSQFLISSASVRFLGATFGILFFPVGLFSFYEQIIDSPKRRLLRRLWQAFLVLGLLIFLVQAFYRFVPFLYLPWGLLFLISLVVGIVASIKGATGRSNVEARIFNIGFLVMLLFVVYDILSNTILPFWHMMAQWGVLAFLFSLAHIIERENAADQRRLRDYSNELQEYSTTLEQKVDQRTTDLKDRNDQLQEAMRQLQQAQEQLVMREKMASLGQVAAGVAHEINNPIGAVQSAADVSNRVIERITNNGDLGKLLPMLKENTALTLEASTRIAKIVKSLSNFAQLDESAYQSGFDIHEGLTSTLELLQSTIPSGVQMETDFGELPRLDGYPSELNQVFLNMLVNASEAIQEPGTITIKTFEQERNVVVEIADTGRGIPEEQREQIFDPGFTTKGAGVGTGLGLSTSYSIIQKHGGRIAVMSKEGKGTTFSIFLPKPQDAPDA